MKLQMEYNAECFWLDVQGKKHNVSFGCHASFASEYLFENNLYLSDGGTSIKQLCELGWLLVKVDNDSRRLYIDTGYCWDTQDIINLLVEECKYKVDEIFIEDYRNNSLHFSMKDFIDNDFKILWR